MSVSRSRAGLPSFASSRLSSWSRHGSIRGQQLPAALIAKLGRLRPDHLASDPSRYSKLAAIVLIGLFWAKYARRIFAIVSTTSIPDLAPVSPSEATVDPPSRGSRLDADHPEKRGPYSMRIHNDGHAHGNRDASGSREPLVQSKSRSDNRA